MPHRVFMLPSVVLFSSILSADTSARTWYVKPDSTGDAPAIQAAMDSARAGDTVLVAPGTYTWTNQGPAISFSMILMKADVTLRGESGAENTILGAERQAETVSAFNVGEGASRRPHEGLRRRVAVLDRCLSLIRRVQGTLLRRRRGTCGRRDSYRRGTDKERQISVRAFHV